MLLNGVRVMYRNHTAVTLFEDTQITHIEDRAHLFQVIIETGCNINEEMIYHELNMEPASYVGQQRGSDSSVPPNLIEHDSL